MRKASVTPKTPVAALAVTTLALLLAACGGGGSDTTPAAPITSVKVFGDSLADSGTFGFKFTVQSATTQVFPERIATSYGLPALCNVYTATSATTVVPNPTQTGCTNSAIGGGRINNTSAPTSPFSIQQQLKNASASTSYTAGDLLIVDGGANDAADLVGAFLAASKDGGASYVALLSTLLPAATVNAAAAQGRAGLAAAGSTYMVALADAFAATLKSAALDKGAQRIALLNQPGITDTPRFQTVLDSIATASGGGAAGASARASSESLFNSWIVAFNTEIAAQFAGNPKVAIVDFYASFKDEVANPASYSLQNVKTPVCPITGVGSDGLPTYTFPTCTDTALSATPPPTGATGGADWWKTYAFADSFHPTPYGHDLLARYVSRTLTSVGWL